MNFEQQLDNYANLTVHVGLNLQPGQRLVIRAPIQTASFVRRVTARAYQAGCRYVDVLWSDEQVELSRYQYAPRDSFEEYPVYRAQGRLEYARNGDASLAVYADDPDLLKDQDPELVSLALRTYQRHNKPTLDLLQRNQFNWCVVSMPVPSWSAKVFPGVSPEEAEARLWEAIFKVCRLDQPDPVAAWQAHLGALSRRSQYLNDKAYTALKLTGPGTDLTVSLPAGHLWLSGQTTSTRGIAYVANMPTEETFTLPHKDQVDGVVSSTRPFSFYGTLIDKFQLTFEKGRVVKFQAETGASALGKLLDTDEGARRLGEIALVPHSSPVSKSGILFYNALFDENAACHLALGSAYKDTLRNGETVSEVDFAAAGGNDSLLHEDFMIGSAEINIDGVAASGACEPVIRQGEWAFIL